MEIDYSKLNNFIEYSTTDKLCDSISQISYPSNGDENGIGTGFFIKLTVNGNELPFFCTAYHVYEEYHLGEFILTLNKKDEYDNNIRMKLNFNNSKIIIDSAFYDTIFIEIQKNEIPENLTLSFLELEKKYLSNPQNYIKSQAILAGYPKKNDSTVNIKDPFISFGTIIKIYEKNLKKRVEYNMYTEGGSSGAPICIFDENNQLKLIAIHIGHDPEGKSNYNTGNLMGDIIDKINNENRINVNMNDEIKKVENIIKSISDKFDCLPSKDFLKDSFISFKDYEKIMFYHEQIVKEYKNQNNDRFIVYHHLLNNHILIHAHDLFKDSMNKFLTVLNSFEDKNYTLDMIRLFNNDIITNYNIILLSDDYILKTKLIYFISLYIQTLNEKNYRYNYRNVKLYRRSIMSLHTLNLIKSYAQKKENIVNLIFIDDIIPLTFFGNLYKLYYDAKKAFQLGYSQTMDQISPINYDTRIFIEQNEENDNQNINIFQFSYWPEIIIAPFSLFRVISVEIDDPSQTAIVNLELLSNENEKIFSLNNAQQEN